MVDENLTDSMIKDGKRVIQALDASDMRPGAAFWLLTEDAGWRLVLSLPPQFETLRPSEIYERIYRILQQQHIDGVSVSELSVAKSGDLYVQLLRKSVTLAGSDAQLRFTGNVVNGYLIRDALIYRMERGSAPRTGTAPRGPMRPGTDRGTPPRQAGGTRTPRPRNRR